MAEDLKRTPALGLRQALPMGSLASQSIQKMSSRLNERDCCKHEEERQGRKLTEINLWLLYGPHG